MSDYHNTREWELGEWVWSDEDNDHVRNPNAEWDNYTGFGRITDDLDERFGCAFQFGYAGGNVNMVAFLDGIAINVTDMDGSGLTPLSQRTAANGFYVGVYACNTDREYGETLLGIATRETVAAELGDVIQAALDSVRRCRHHPEAQAVAIVPNDNASIVGNHPLARVTYSCGHWEFVRHDKMGGVL